MTLLIVCMLCQLGYHADHYTVVQAVPEGALGGSRCRCEGEHVDGRYKPDDSFFKKLATFADATVLEPITLDENQ